MLSSYEMQKRNICFINERLVPNVVYEACDEPEQWKLGML